MTHSSVTVSYQNHRTAHSHCVTWRKTSNWGRKKATFCERSVKFKFVSLQLKGRWHNWWFAFSVTVSFERYPSDCTHKQKSFTYISQIQEAVEEDKSHVLPSHSLHEKYSSVTRRTETAQIKNEKFKKYLKELGHIAASSSEHEATRTAQRIKLLERTEN